MLPCNALLGCVAVWQPAASAMELGQQAGQMEDTAQPARGSDAGSCAHPAAEPCSQACRQWSEAGSDKALQLAAAVYAAAERSRSMCGQGAAAEQLQKRQQEGPRGMLRGAAAQQQALAMQPWGQACCSPLVCSLRCSLSITCP